MKNTYVQHIKKYLFSLLNEEDERFRTIFDKITLPQRTKYEPLLLYIHKILDRAFDPDANDLQTLHLHLEKDLDPECKKAIAHYLIFRTYMEHLEKDKKNDQTSQQLGQLVAHLKAEKIRLTVCPSDASGANGNKVYKRWKENRANNKRDLAFYSQELYRTFYPYTLFNCSAKFLDKIAPSLYPYALHIDTDEKWLSYTFLNAHPFHTIQSMKKGEHYFIPSIERLILFDRENTSRFQEFNMDRLNVWNQRQNTQFRQLLFITFGKETTCVEHIKRKTDLVKGRFRIGDNTSYTITTTELDMLMEKSMCNIPIRFWGAPSTTFVDLFLSMVQDLELYELRSFRMLDLYSLLFTENAKRYVLNDLFLPSEDSDLVSEETKRSILELSAKEKDALKGTLRALIDLVHLDNIYRTEIMRKLSSDTLLVVPDPFINNKILKDELTHSLALSVDQQLITWAEVDLSTDKRVLILAYKDQGRYPYHFFPNLLETIFSQAKEVNAYFISSLFKLHYEWANYHLLRTTHRYLSHHIRESEFAWKELYKKIRAGKPEQKDKVYWELENKYSYSEERGTYKIRFDSTKKTKTYVGSELFITSKSLKPPYSVERLDELATIDLSDDDLCIQSIYEILSEINVYERMIDVDQQEAELKVIRSQYNVDDTTPGRLWKILLKNRAESSGTFLLYDELKGYLELHGLSLVSFDHFVNTWIVPESGTLTPINKKVFRSVCDFLELPPTYFYIMQRIRNANVQASKESSRKMSNLLRDLINDGCFDNPQHIRQNIKKNLYTYKKHHSLEEISIHQEYFLDSLVTLVDLILPEIDLQPVNSIKKT